MHLPCIMKISLNVWYLGKIYHTWMDTGDEILFDVFPKQKDWLMKKNPVEKSRCCKMTRTDLGTQNLNLHIRTSAISGETSLGHYSGELMTTRGIKKEFAHPIVACI